MTDEKLSLMSLALKILHDECPPDNSTYLCKLGEDPEDTCVNCWTNYLY